MRPGPLRDSRNQIAAGVYLGIWSLVGWWSFARTPALWSGDYGADPGPGLLPMLVLAILSAGSMLLVAAGVRHSIVASTAKEYWREVSRGSMRPAILVLTLLIFVSAIGVLGFAISTIFFCFAWMFVLGYAVSGKKAAVLQAAIGTGVGVTLVYVVFVYLIGVPL